MICKNCANIFSDDLSVCPECGTSVAGADTHTDDESQDEIERIVSVAVSGGGEQKSIPTEFEDIFSYSEEQMAQIEIPVEEPQNEPYEETETPDTDENKEETEDKEEKPVRRSGARVRPEKVKLRKMSKKEKGAFNFVISLMAVVFITMIALVGIRLGTDVFEKNEDEVKAIALSGFSAAETAELEDYLSKIGIVAYNGYDRDKEVIVDVMAYLRPQDPGGLYSRFYGSAELTANTPDPNGRFMNENGDYSYYVLDTEPVDEILSTFGFSINHNVNEKNFYCYNDKYYFANVADYTFSAGVVADVTSSKRIQDGSYYAECSFYDATAEESNNSYLKTYIILDKYEHPETGATQWEISRISHEAIFDSMGFMVEDESGINELSYRIENETIEAVTEDGKVYARYILEYPVFKGDTKGEKVSNQLFSDLANSYKAGAESATKDYKKFIKDGGNKEELPYVTYIVARVTYNRNGYISIVEGISEYKPQPESKAGQTQDGEFIPVALPERSIEGYIIDVETGHFLSKNEVIDVEYTLVHDILYRIYNGYEYESLLSEDVADSQDIPEDTDEAGKTFYESASAMGYSGYVFCYVNPKGYTENIVIPYETENFFNEDFSRKTTE